MIYRIFLNLILLFFSLQAFAINPQENFMIHFNSNADFFHIMDQITSATPLFFADPAYQAAWQKKVGISADDQILFEQYKILRNKYQHYPVAYMSKHGTTKNVSGLFSPDPASVQDPILDAFYTSQTLEETLHKLSGILSQDEIAFLRKFFQHFDSEYQTLTQIDPQKEIIIVSRLNELLTQPEAQKHFAHMVHFYHASDHPFQSILLFWCPEDAGMSGASFGNHLWLAIPINTTDMNNETLRHFLVSALVHEATHHVSGEAPTAQKQRLSARFMQGVKTVPADQDYIFLLEEPLVMASQMLFFKTYYPKYYNPDAPWFNNPYAKDYETILEQYYQADKPIDEDFIEACVKAYNSKHAMI